MHGDPLSRPCGEAMRGCHPTHRYMLDRAVYQCPGGDVALQQPAPPPSAEERVRDLEYMLQRVREAAGTDAVLVGCEDHEARITALHGALADVLKRFVHPGHPGEPCKQTGWVSVRTIDKWHAVLRGEA